MYVRPIPDTHHSVDRPIIKSLVCQLVDWGVLPPYKEYDYQPVLKKRKTKGEGERVTYKTDKVLVVNADTRPTEGMNSPNPLNPSNPQELPIFLDREREIALQPLYKHVTTELTLVYHTTSLSTLTEWQDSVFSKTRAGADRFIHDLSYSYSTHQDTTEFLRNVHKCIEGIGGYGEDFSTYLSKHFLNSTVVLASRAAKQLNIAEVQSKVTGYLDLNETISITDLGDGKYTGELKYTLYYAMPYAIMHIYPVQIHQQLLPTKYLPVNLINKTSIGTVRNRILDGYVLDKKGNHYKEIRVPAFDNNKVSSAPLGYNKVWTVMLAIDRPEPQVLFNLREIPDICMEPWVFCLLDSFIDYLQQPFKTPLLISLHQADSLYDITYCKVESNMDVVSLRPLNLRKTYHVSLSIITSIESLTDKAACKVNADCKDSIPDLVDSINFMKEQGFQDDFSTRRLISPEDFCANGTRPGAGVGMYTVMTSIVESYRFGSKMFKEE